MTGHFADVDVFYMFNAVAGLITLHPLLLLHFFLGLLLPLFLFKSRNLSDILIKGDWRPQYFYDCQFTTVHPSSPCFPRSPVPLALFCVLALYWLSLGGSERILTGKEARRTSKAVPEDFFLFLTLIWPFFSTQIGVN